MFGSKWYTGQDPSRFVFVSLVVFDLRFYWFIVLKPMLH
jgi:hypothetical protein